MTTRTKKPARVKKSSGNVFADLGLPHPEQELLKAQLTLQIYRLIKGRALTQAEAGKILGIKQPHVSALMRNRSGTFSLERLRINAETWGCLMPRIFPASAWVRARPLMSR